MVCRSAGLPLWLPLGGKKGACIPVVAFVGLLAFSGLLCASAAEPPEDDERIVRGQILDQDGKVVPRAIVHLKNLATREGFSVVTDKEGRYRFNGVDMKADHEVYAEWRQQKSRTRSISQFDTRPLVIVNLTVKPPKKSESSDEKDSRDKDKDESG